MNGLNLKITGNLSLQSFFPSFQWSLSVCNPISHTLYVKKCIVSRQAATKLDNLKFEENY